MAPTDSTMFVHLSNHPSSRHHLHLRRQGPSFTHRPLGQPLGPHTEQPMARTPDAALQSSTVLQGPPPPPLGPTPSESVVFIPEPSAISTNPQASNQPDITGNVLAAVVVIVLILGGLVGLVVGGEMLRRRAKVAVVPPPSRCLGRRKSKPIKKIISGPQERTQTTREKFPYDEKTLTPLTRPPPILNVERQRRLSNIWPIRSLSMAVSNRLSCPVRVEGCLERPSPTLAPQTTWSEFSPVTLYVPPSRTVLTCIPEEREDFQSQTNSDLEAILGVTFQRLPESGAAMSTLHANGSRSPLDTPLDGFDGQESSAARHLPDPRMVYEAVTSDEDAKSLGSSAPDMTSDGGESSRSSMASLESLEGNESLREEAFELRRAQTRSMQMNKGVLLSLSSKTLDDGQDAELTHGERGPSRPASTLGEDGCKGPAERDSLNLAMLGGDFSAVDLDDFPSLPSVLPVIPSFVSGF